MQPELRLVRYFVAVAEEGNFTRAAERLTMAQPPLSAAIRQLEAQLGVRLLDRTSRSVVPTAAGRLLLERGRDLLRVADETFAAVRAVDREPAGLVRVGLSPAGRHGILPRLLRAWEEAAPGLMVHSREDTTGALLRDVARSRLDLAVVFCPPDGSGVAMEPLVDAPAVVHLREDHPLADRTSLRVSDLRDETLVVAGGPDSPGYTRAVVEMCAAAGIAPRTVPDPYPDLGVRAVREGLGVVVYVADAFPGEPAGTRLVPLEPPAALPFVLAWHGDGRHPAVGALRAAAREAVAGR